VWISGDKGKETIMNIYIYMCVFVCEKSASIMGDKEGSGRRGGGREIERKHPNFMQQMASASRRRRWLLAQKRHDRSIEPTFLYIVV
jgi:hypothetical protein